MKAVEIVREVLDDVYEPSRPSKDSIDQSVSEILSKVGDGITSGDAAFVEIAVYLTTAYGSPYSARAAGIILMDSFKIPYQAPEDATI